MTALKKGEPTGEDFIYPVATDAKVYIYGREARLKDLANGTQIVAKLSSDKKTIGVIQAQGPTVNGVLKAVDGTKNTVTVMVQVKGQPLEEKTFNVVKDAPIHIAAAPPGRLADLEKERGVTLWLSADQKMVVSIMQKSGKKPMQ